MSLMLLQVMFSNILCVGENICAETTLIQALTNNNSRMEKVKMKKFSSRASKNFPTRLASTGSNT